MSLEMQAQCNEWTARIERITRRQLSDPNYTPHSSEFDLIVLEPNFFERYPYMRYYVNKPVNDKTFNSIISTSKAKTFLNYIITYLIVSWAAFSALEILIDLGVDYSTLIVSSL